MLSAPQLWFPLPESTHTPKKKRRNKKSHVQIPGKGDNSLRWWAKPCPRWPWCLFPVGRQVCCWRGVTRGSLDKPQHWAHQPPQQPWSTGKAPLDARLPVPSPPPHLAPSRLKPAALSYIYYSECRWGGRRVILHQHPRRSYFRALPFFQMTAKHCTTLPPSNP